jgi:transposase
VTTVVGQDGILRGGCQPPPSLYLEKLYKEAFQQLWDYNSPAWAGKFLDDWCRQVMRSRIEPMKKIARSLRQHRELILNYFRAQKLLSGGVVECLNNQAKVTVRKSYGFRTFRCLELITQNNSLSVSTF